MATVLGDYGIVVVRPLFVCSPRVSEKLAFLWFFKWF